MLRIFVTDQIDSTFFVQIHWAYGYHYEIQVWTTRDKKGFIILNKEGDFIAQGEHGSLDALFHMMFAAMPELGLRDRVHVLGTFKQLVAA